MKDLLTVLREFNVWSVSIRLIAAAIIGGIIGAERGRHGRDAGLRTHILICIGAATTALTSLFLKENLYYSGDITRISAQVISGIGFLGAGTILIRSSSVITGLTTAAGIWTTAAIGIAVGYGFYLGAIVATAIVFFSVTVLRRAERKQKSQTGVYVELTEIADTEAVVETICQAGAVSYDVIPAKSGCSAHVGIFFFMSNAEQFTELKKELNQTGHVAMMLRNINS